MKNSYITPSLLMIFLCVTSLKLMAQTEPPPPPKPGEKNKDKILIYQEVEAMPKGGILAFRKYLAKNLIYPKPAREKKIQGMVFIQFYIEKDGGLSSFKIIKGLGHGCDKEAVRLLKSSEKWIPGKKDGKPARILRMIDIKFKL